MRLWTLHPQYLDAKGLVALWREALLAQAVLAGLTRGYTRHPQLIRFRQAVSPAECIASYLSGVHAEAARRGYHFDERKIPFFHSLEPIPSTRGQLDYEWARLAEKLRHRSPSWFACIKKGVRPLPHPLFRVVPGPAEDWEKGAPAGRSEDPGVLRGAKAAPRATQSSR